MQVNEEYDLTRALASAIKAKAPYVGLPIPGHAPLVLERKLLVGALRGVMPVNVEVLTEGAERSLLVEGMAAPHIRTRMKMHSKTRNDWAVRQAMWAWTESERKARIRAASLPCERKAAAKYKKQTTVLEKLQRELKKLGHPVELRNPTCPKAREFSDGGEYYRNEFRTLYAGKRLRTIIGAIAAQARRDAWKNTQLYKELTAHGIEFTKLSGMTAKEREKRCAETWFDYLKNLYCFCHGTGYTSGSSYRYSIRGEHNRGDGQTWGGGRYMEKLADIETRRSLEEQIASIKAMLGEPVEESLAA